MKRMKMHTVYIVRILITCIVLSCFSINVMAEGNATALVAWEEGFLFRTDDGMDYVTASDQMKEDFVNSQTEFTMFKTIDSDIYMGYGDGQIVRADKEGQIIEEWQVDGEPIDIEKKNDMVIIATTEKIIVDNNEEIKEYFLDSPIVGVAAAKYAVVAAAKDGTMLVQTEDGSFKKINSQKNITVTDIDAANDVVYVTGYDQDLRPILTYTLAGEVWADRKLVMVQDTSIMVELQAVPLDIGYSETLEALVLSCTDGKIVILPSCVSCNAFYQISEKDLTNLAVNGEYIGFLEDGTNLKIINSSQVPTRINPAGDCDGGC